MQFGLFILSELFCFRQMSKPADEDLCLLGAMRGLNLASILRGKKETDHADSCAVACCWSHLATEHKQS